MASGANLKYLQKFMRCSTFQSFKNSLQLTSPSVFAVSHRHCCSTQFQYRKMSTSTPLQGKDKVLFTPGPLGVTMSVKKAMLRDVGSRDKEFIECIKFIRRRILEIAGVSDKDFCCIPIQGSGTFAVDASFQTVLPREGAKALIIENGAYGKRMASICKAAGISCDVQSFREDSIVEPQVVEDALSGRTKYDLVSIVHSETSSGVINPVMEVGNIVKELSPDSIYLVDAVSSFGAVPLNIEDSRIDVLISSANKCLQGVPGFAFVIARNSVMNNCQGNSRSLSLDLYDQVKQLDKTNQFRFTPATHSMLAFKQALLEFEQEGGVEGRARRYINNRTILQKGMSELGFKELLDKKIAGHIITSYLYPKDPNFNFTEFYNRLNDKDLVIYPGKVLDIDCFRIGTIGDLHAEDMKNLLKAIREVCNDMKIKIPIQN
ncbi:2-aminoethylphosphonate--pyruvate transaminase-like [Physella acuta]|uniref:2-aminoethylphosphonate--pyruvate transaminase-like n=1 Tax=Physella acuta TaxID=109671 RepID=UPI0027DACB5A|nr:2-aminoethylphosphonate--pyruvate transaminase-like [Physella acuta]